MNNPQRTQTDSLIERLANASAQQSAEQVGDYARVDTERAHRKGVPEVVLAERKTPEHTVGIVERMLAATGLALVSRVPAPTVAALQAALPPTVAWERGTADRIITLRTPEYEAPPHRGDVGIISAGTSDLPAAEEAAAVCRAMGCPALMVTDVGVAGLHRLFGPLRAMLEHPVDAIIVAAGMDGALPSVIAGLVDVPVIGLPTAVGYGMGGNGEAALLSMLQTCAPGLAVVNIDNGVGAGAMAALIARRAARHGEE
jgi:pyridinium-3,5-biscarboxylic acid mononucleotide synthase